MTAHTTEVTFWPKVEKTATCWLWKGSRDSLGYGAVKVGGHTRRAHRVAWEFLREPIPPGLTLDHLCRVRHCVNPNHLEVVTLRENILRGMGVAANHARQTTCIHGHPLTPENSYCRSGGRERRCRACGAASSRVYRKKKQQTGG